MASLKQSIGYKRHMSLDDVGYLINSITIVDDLLQEVQNETRELVYCSALSIGQKEFGVTMQNKLRAEKVFVIDYDTYDGQNKFEYRSTVYSIYRTFVRNDGYIELYCEVRIGGY